jgi:hypothetical protein
VAASATTAVRGRFLGEMIALWQRRKSKGVFIKTRAILQRGVLPFHVPREGDSLALALSRMQSLPRQEFQSGEYAKS